LASGARRAATPEPRDGGAGAPVSPVYFLLHVPKTAGQTIELHLREYCAPGAYCEPRRPGLLRRLARDGNPGDAIPDSGAVRALGGHHLGRSLEACFPQREIRRTVLLRDPLGLHLSLYNFRMMSYLARGLGTYSFALHLNSLRRNPVAHFLLSGWLEIPALVLAAMSDARKYALLNRMLSQFWFVGAHTDCDRLIAAIAPDLGVPAVAQRRNTSREWRAQVAWEPLTAEALSGEVRDAVATRDRIDQALWESWRGAGFGAASVRPRPLPQRGAGASAAALLRPACDMARLFRRDWARPAYIGRGRRVARADAARNAGDWATAAQRYRAVVARHATPAMWMQYGHAEQMAGNAAAAEAAYREAILLKADNADAHYYLGTALQALGREPEAASAYRRALALDPALSEARGWLEALGGRADDEPATGGGASL